MNNKIKTCELNIDDIYHFTNDSCELIIRDDKINFIYANNGSGKTTFSNYIASNHSNDFELIEINNNIWLTDSNKILISKNINRIKQIEQEINKGCFILSKKIKSIIEKYDYSNGNKFVKNFIVPFYKNKWPDLLDYVIVSKQNLKNYLLDFDKLSFIDKELKKNTKLENQINVNFEKSRFDNHTFSGIEEIYSNIKSKINELNNKIKFELIEEFKKKNIDRFVFEKVYDEINKLDSMDTCYICENEIKNFQQIKTRMKEKLNELRDKYSDVSDLEKNLKQWDNLFNNNLFKDYSKNNWDNVVKEIDKSFLNFQNWLDMFIIDISRLFNDNKDEWNKIYNLNQELEILNKDKKLKNLRQDDFELIKDIIDSIVGPERIKYNFNSEQLIEINLINEDLPFSTGEKSIISLIFSLVYFSSINNSNNIDNKIYIIDDIENSLDYLNIINFSHIIKTFFFDYHFRFLICTHNPQLIKQMWDSGVKDIWIYTLFKTFNGTRKLTCYEKNNNDDTIKFLGFNSGLRALCDTIKDNWQEISNNDKTIFVLYICWICRQHKLIFKKDKYNNIINFLKFSCLFNCSNDDEIKKEFYSIFKDVKEFCELDNDYNLSYEDFRKIINSWKGKINSIKINLVGIPLLINTNINNLVKILFAREFLLFNLSELCQENKIKREENTFKTRKMLNDLENKKIINSYTRKKILYIWNFLSTFYHNENLSSLLLNGIELNDQITYEIIENLENIFNNKVNKKGIKND